jgi:EAL domain-containing protein (putative c-di-GMP-specific phosphodiesterase class I)
LGCDLVQGFWLARPMPMGQIPEFLERSQRAIH